jgi:AAA+ superfamily predicted ATPase
MKNQNSKHPIACMIEKYWLLKNAQPKGPPLDLSKINESTEIKVVLDDSKEKNNNKILKLFRKSDLDLKKENKHMTSLIQSLDNSEKQTYEYVQDTKRLLKLLIEQNNVDYMNYKNKNLFTNNYVPALCYDPNLAETIQEGRVKIPPGFKPLEENKEPLIKEKVFINKEVKCLLDLINMCDEYPDAENIEYNINMKSIRKIRPHLEELNALIGMHTLKENIVDQILYYVQDFHKMNGSNSCPTDYMHTVIYGPPGTGKTEVAKIMGKIFSNLGVLTSGVFKKVTRDDLVAGYLGQTATKTKEVLKSCRGGVLFIDEAYALGNSEKRDSFSKESIDTICEALSDMRGELMCIIAGYEKELKQCFFSYNEGLESRFTWQFKIDEYKSDEMNMIFNKKVKDLGWKMKSEENNDWFDKNMSYFKYFGRDMETLLSKTKIAHSRRVFCLPIENKGILSKEDLEKGMKMFMNNESIQKRQEEENIRKQIYNTMFL